MTIGELCNREPVYVTEDDTVLEAAQRMREFHVGDVVVVREEGGVRRPVGMITDRDMVVGLLARDVEHLPQLLVRDVLSQPVVTATEGERVIDVLHRMRGHHIRRIPVVDAAGALVGIFAVDDMLELLADELGSIAALVHEQPRREGELR